MIDVGNKTLRELENEGIELVVSINGDFMIWAPKTYEYWFPVFSYKEISLMHAMGKERAIECLRLAYGLKSSLSSSCSVSRTCLLGK